LSRRALDVSHVILHSRPLVSSAPASACAPASIAASSPPSACGPRDAKRTAGGHIPCELARARRAQALCIEREST